ncbi:immunoglobulin superfamily member 1-like isoform X2 [Macrotis lagotis]|uniref:immunoglobulin superfamily member 1-like isoform X2 n=1 Tax=Macrotis lagotis TaxID=92651 RepID=UPI003D682E1B
MCPTFIFLYVGSLSKPRLQALQAPIVTPGGDVTLQCILPSNSYSEAVTFILQKAQMMEPIQKKTGEWAKANFTMYSLRPQDTGNYSCTFHETRGSNRVSEPSETLELWVTETLPKPSLSAIHSQLVVTGENVTLWCWGPIRGLVLRFALYKEGEESCVGVRMSTQGGAEFHLTHVNINNSGNYSCRCDLGPVSNVSISSSDLLELTVFNEEQRKNVSLEGEKDIPSQHPAQTEVFRNILILIILIVMSCILFLAILGHQFSQTVISHGKIPRRSPDCFSQNPGSPQEGPVYMQRNKRRPREIVTREDEDTPFITYMEFDNRVLREAQLGVPSMIAPKPTFYASLAIYCGTERDPSLKSDAAIQDQGRTSNQD